MKILLLMPILIPFITGIFMILSWGNRKFHRGLSVLSSGIQLVVGFSLLWCVYSMGIVSVQAGSWPAPFGITFVADIFSAIMVAVTGIISLMSSIYSLALMDEERETYGYYPLVHILLMGINGSFLTGDIFNMYVWFEVMLISSFVLIALGGTREQIEGSIKYVTLNLLASAIFLTSVAILYGIAGSLNLAYLAKVLPLVENRTLVTIVSMLFLVAFGIKSAIFPLFFWLPASYHTPPTPVTALIGGLLTKVGVYALFRVFTMLFVHDITFTHTIIIVLAGFTMVTGVLGPVAQMDFRRILSFHIVSQVGYMIMALGLFTPLALAGGILYIVHNIFAKTNLFLISGVVKAMYGTTKLEKLGGIHKKYPLLGALFLISAFALAGVPPLSGFWGKFVLSYAGLQQGSYGIIAAALFVGMLTLFSMVKIWNYVFWRDEPENSSGLTESFKSMKKSERIYLFTPVVVMAIIILLISFGIDPVFSLMQRAADQLMSPSGYIEAVLGGTY